MVTLDAVGGAAHQRTMKGERKRKGERGERERDEEGEGEREREREVKALFMAYVCFSTAPSILLFPLL